MVNEDLKKLQAAYIALEKKEKQQEQKIEDLLL